MILTHRLHQTKYQKLLPQIVVSHVVITDFEIIGEQNLSG